MTDKKCPTPQDFEMIPKTSIDYHGKQYVIKYRIHRFVHGATHELVLGRQIFTGASLEEAIKKFQAEIDKQEEDPKYPYD